MNLNKKRRESTDPTLEEESTILTQKDQQCYPKRAPIFGAPSGLYNRLQVEKTGFEPILDLCNRLRLPDYLISPY